MITKVTVALQNADEAKRFALAINDALELDGEDTLAEASGKQVEVTWGDTLDPEELFTALGEARDEMEWDF